ncbi:MAG: hypothetical protein LBJ03_04135 [Holosporales bacterium]|nr:hypothetical protein [Holosporales bacterium]
MSWKEDGKARDQQQVKAKTSRPSAAAKFNDTPLKRRLGGRKDLLGRYRYCSKWNRKAL